VLNKKQAEELVEISAELAIQQWLFITEETIDDEYLTCDGCVKYLLDMWLELWIRQSELLRLADGKTEPCTWTEDFDGTWDAECGEKWVFCEGGPKVNGVRGCFYCGKRIREKKYKE
jgi:hypothetical protein